MKAPDLHNPEVHAALDRYWRANMRTMFGLLLIWAGVSFGCDGDGSFSIGVPGDFRAGPGNVQSGGGIAHSTGRGSLSAGVDGGGSSLSSPPSSLPWSGELGRDDLLGGEVSTVVSLSGVSADSGLRRADLRGGGVSSGLSFMMSGSNSMLGVF